MLISCGLSRSLAGSQGQDGSFVGAYLCGMENLVTSFARSWNGDYVARRRHFISVKMGSWRHAAVVNFGSLFFSVRPLEKMLFFHVLANGVRVPCGCSMSIKNSRSKMLKIEPWFTYTDVGSFLTILSH